ncbi:HAD family hydrolase [Shimia abyssi]|uniref:phosphoglycolate phosphatase n=1 Tax=Shimia abyssi TaxID=1662395 RepID=A0A2P8FHP6_9RHOB|nr:HAD family phosphatase [Shimia abyssi]PSL21251.1 HAD superfamily hydrolase (TIGR01509 family) [Shimia abyssi]
MRPELVIFDCDGVLVDTEVATCTVISRNLAEYGLDLSPTECLGLFVGGTIYSACEEARRRGADLADGWVDEMYAQIFDTLRAGVRVLPGIPEVLARLKALDIPDCVASNGPPEKMQVSLGPSGLWDHFDGRIWSPHTHGPAKPDPGLLLMAAEHFGVDPAACVMIDDSPAGVIAAQKAGIRAIGFDENGALGRVSGMGAEVIEHIDALHDLLSLTP